MERPSRPLEFRLLVSILGFSLLLALLLLKHEGLLSCRLCWMVFLAPVYSSFLSHFLLRLAAFPGNEMLLPIMAMLSQLGFAFQIRLEAIELSTKPNPMVICFIAGPLVFSTALLTLRHSPARFRRLFPFGAYLLSFALFLYLYKFGIHYRGSIYGPGLTTPQETLKLAFPLFFAWFLYRYNESVRQTFLGIPFLYILFSRRLFIFLFIWLAPQAGLVFLKNLGDVLLFNCVFLMMLIAATGHWRYLAIAVLLLAVVILGAQKSEVNMGRRIAIFLDPWADVDGGGWQTVQALFSLNAGGYLGAGLGQGSPEEVPIVVSDFIYAAVAEELGLAGCLAIIVLYWGILYLGFHLAGSCSVHLYKLYGIGLTCVLFMQIIINVGGVVHALPISGMVLPFLSKGGTTLLVNWAMGGILVALPDMEN